MIFKKPSITYLYIFSKYFSTVNRLYFATQMDIFDFLIGNQNIFLDVIYENIFSVRNY